MLYLFCIKRVWYAAAAYVKYENVMYQVFALWRQKNDILYRGAFYRVGENKNYILNISVVCINNLSTLSHSTTLALVAHTDAQFKGLHHFSADRGTDVVCFSSTFVCCPLKRYWSGGRAPPMLLLFSCSAFLLLFLSFFLKKHGHLCQSGHTTGDLYRTVTVTCVSTHNHISRPWSLFSCH